MDTSTYPAPIFVSPALPSDLVQFIINRCSYPTTLIICADRAEFLSCLTQDLIQQQRPYQSDSHPQRHTTEHPHDTTADPTHQDDEHADRDTRPATAAPPPNQPQPEPQQPRPPPPPPPPPPNKPHPLLTPNLSQLSTTRHIRTIFVPTVSHLRAFLSLFPDSSISSAKISSPPQLAQRRQQQQQTAFPLLVVFSFLALHRHTSEWSAQGLGASSALLVEAGRRAGMGVVLVESVGGSASPRQQRGMAAVLGRWFRFREGEWYGRCGGGAG
ncbi:hypothetical protein N658DRAFT_526343 [Parathielavia hyrcaniae]|uniref:Uncharacterized protein n=1 Tax=Parathielavia hyrcaniae TaxID=113614 RepID=A0AAN6SYP7_9PEZI|nr:hypothetical protein N658DRAFT_526343 [Parathielavia hyrcaniae]